MKMKKKEKVVAGECIMYWECTQYEKTCCKRSFNNCMSASGTDCCIHLFVVIVVRFHH